MKNMDKKKTNEKRKRLPRLTNGKKNKGKKKEKGGNEKAWEDGNGNGT